MTLYLPVDKSQRAHERDRIQWSDLFTINFDVIARGIGEGLIEPVYFGAAYDLPPTFDYAAVWAGDIAVDITALGVQHEKVNKVRGASGSSLLADHNAPDGSFEHQMVWNDPVIPQWDQNDVWNRRYQKINDEQSLSYNRATPWTEGEYANWWVQEPRPSLWKVTSEKAREPSVGPKGSNSAKNTLDSNGTSGWLVPVNALSPVGIFSFDDVNVGQIDQTLRSYDMPVNSAACNGPDAPSQNPDMFMRHELWVYSESPYTLELDYLLYHTAFPNPTILDTVGDPVNWQSEYEDNLEFEMSGTGWEKIEYDVRPPGHLWPGAPWPRFNIEEWDYDPDGNLGVPTEDHAVSGLTAIPARIMFRVKNGQPGQELFIDEARFYVRFEVVDAPLITVGVYEWIRDEAGAYVGARLWVKIDTPAPPIICFNLGKDS